MHLPRGLRFLFLLAILAHVTSGEKILVFLGLSSHSHRVAIQPIATALAEAGHDVTVFSPLKPEVGNPKIKEFCTQEMIRVNEEMASDSSGKTAEMRLRDRYYDPFFEGDNLWQWMEKSVRGAVESQEFREWINTTHFDLIIFDHFGKEYLYPLAHAKKAKIIDFLPMTTPFLYDFDVYGLPLEPWFLDVVENKNEGFLPDRLFYGFTQLIWYLQYKYRHLPLVERLVKEYVPIPDFPPIEHLMKNVDLLLINEWSSGRAYPPYVIPVGGMHAKPSNGTLSKELEEFVADADQFIFISFGSIIRVSAFPKEFQQVLFDAVGSVGPKTRVLWKWEGEIPENMPKNAFAKNWFPQQDVLAHPKCKGFVTQGGQMSIQQGIYHGVPLLVIPGFGDQPMNARITERKGYGMYLELADITRETFSQALWELVGNPRYAEKMRQTSQAFKDRPMPPVQTAVWWVEYVLRSNASAQLRHWPGMSATWWERRMLDLWAGLFILLTASSILIFYLTRTIFRILTDRSLGSAQKLKSS